jgi:hypothetical protein
MCGLWVLEVGGMQAAPSGVITGGANRRKGDHALSFMQYGGNARFMNLADRSPSRFFGSPRTTREGTAGWAGEACSRIQSTTTAHFEDETDVE